MAASSDRTSADGVVDLGDRLLPFAERSLGRQIMDRADSEGDRRFLKVGDGSWISYEQAADRAQRVAGGLSQIGLGAGDHIALLLPNSEPAVFAWFGAAMRAAVEVPINTNLKGPLLRHVLADSRSAVLVVDSALLDNALPVLTGLDDLRQVVVVGGVDDGPERVAQRRSDLEVTRWADIAQADPVTPSSTTPHDPIAMMYTSGTTGPAKGVVCPHGYFSCWADDTGRAIRFGGDDVLYSPLPLFHLTGQAVNVQMALVHRGQVMMDSRFSPRDFWERMADLGATTVWSFGSMTPLLYKREPTDADRAHAVDVFWSIPWPSGYGRDFEDRFGVRILCGYGSTEQGLTLVQPYGSTQADTVGQRSPHYDVAIVDERGRPVPDGEVGEIVTRPTEPASMMTQYLGRAEETVQAWRDLWYHTGDRGIRQPDGYVRFVDRKSDAIRRRGENISAWEIESVVNGHPQIEECAAIGVPSEFGEDDVKLVAVASDELTPRDLFDYCFEELPYYMVPRYIELVGELPKTPSLRVQKFKLRERGVTEATWDRRDHGLEVRRPRGT